MDRVVEDGPLIMGYSVSLKLSTAALYPGPLGAGILLIAPGKRVGSGFETEMVMEICK